jgi:hypothetical protein
MALLPRAPNAGHAVFFDRPILCEINRQEKHYARLESTATSG